MGLLTRSERQRLMELLLRIPNTNGAAGRQLLLVDLPKDLQVAIPFDNSATIHIANIIDIVSGEAFARLADGSIPLLVVIENAVFMVRTSALAGQLQVLYAALLTRASAQQAADAAPGAAAVLHTSSGSPAGRDHTPAQQYQLYTALLSAFPTVGDLERMVQLHLGKNIEIIAGGTNLAEMVLHLLQWATAQGQLEALLCAARTANPGNSSLRVFAA